MVQRTLLDVLRQTKKSVLLLGPRQTGKSTLLQQLAPDLTINLASESEFLNHNPNPSLLESLVEAEKPKLVFIDEIQRIPSLLNTIQVIIDDSKKNKRPILFLLSGSSARKLRRGQANLLPGRVVAYFLSGLSVIELDYKLDYPKALTHGFLPEPYLEKSSSTASKILESYAAIYLKEEIQAEALTKNISGFARFLNTMASYSGLIFDATKISQRAKVSRSSLLRFVEILEDTLIAQRVPSFVVEGMTIDVVKHPKFYLFDPGVLNGLVNNFTVSQDRVGNLFEHLVYAQIRNSCIAKDVPHEIYFFRTRSGVEVDFILKLRNQIWAIEVKSGNVITSDLNDLKRFNDYFPDVHRSIVISLNEKKRVVDGILIGSLTDFIKELFD